MRRTLVLLGIATATCAGGCAVSTVRLYRSMHDVEQARSQAGLIVQGEVIGTEPLDAHPVANPYPHPLDPLGQIITEYAVRTRVTLRPTEVIKRNRSRSGSTARVTPTSPTCCSVGRCRPS